LDVLQGEKLLKPLIAKYGKQLRYFRHPYLARGSTAGKIDSLTAFLASAGYQEAPVTINNRDYLFSSAYEKALLKKDIVLAKDIGNQYVDYMMASVRFYESQADSLFHHPIPHILLTHANIDQLILFGYAAGKTRKGGLPICNNGKSAGTSGIPVARPVHWPGGISWIQRWALTQGKPESFCDGEPEIPATIMNP
jgi:hypothetical protein